MKTFKQYLEIVNEAVGTFTINLEDQKNYTVKKIANEIMGYFQYNFDRINIIKLDENLKKDATAFISELQDELNANASEMGGYRYKKAKVELMPNKNEVKVTLTKNPA